MDKKLWGIDLDDHTYYEGYGELWDEVYYEIEAPTKEEAIEIAREWWYERTPDYELDCNVSDDALDQMLEWWIEREPRIHVEEIKRKRF